MPTWQEPYSRPLASFEPVAPSKLLVWWIALTGPPRFVSIDSRAVESPAALAFFPLISLEPPAQPRVVSVSRDGLAFLEGHREPFVWMGGRAWLAFPDNRLSHVSGRPFSR